MIHNRYRTPGIQILVQIVMRPSNLRKRSFKKLTKKLQLWVLLIMMLSLNSLKKDQELHQAYVWYSIRLHLQTKILLLVVVTRKCKQKLMNTTKSLYIYKRLTKNSIVSSVSTMIGRGMSKRFFQCLKTGKDSPEVSKLKPDESFKLYQDIS